MKRVLSIVGIVFLIGIVIRFSFFTVPAGEAVVVTQFGKPVKTITEPGLQWKLPGILQRINRMDARIEVFNSQPIQLLLGDKNPIITTVFIAWKIKSPLLYFQSLALPTTARQKLTDMVVSALGGLLGQYSLEDIINVEPEKVKLTELETALLTSTTAQAQEKYGIEVVRVGFRRITYPRIVAEAVYNRMRAEREKEAKRYRAEGMEAAAKIEATTDREASALMAEAYKQAEILKGQGDQEASRIYAEAYGQAPEFFEFLKALELYQAAVNERTTVIMGADSKLLGKLPDEASTERQP